MTDAEVVTLAVAQAMLNISHDADFFAAATKRLGHLFPKLPATARLLEASPTVAETIEWLIGIFAHQCPGYDDEVVLLDSTPVECGRSVETVRRSQLADACGYGYSRSHSRWFWGMRLHLLAAPDGTPRAAILAPADQSERDVALRMLPIGLRGGETIVADKGCPRPHGSALAGWDRGAAEPYVVGCSRTRAVRRNASRDLGAGGPRGWTPGTPRADHQHPHRRHPP